MQYKTLGKSGLLVSRLGLGMMSYGDTSRRQWHLDYAEAEPIVRCAAEAGVTFFDTADMYDLGASEIATGKLLSTIFSKREEYVLATKVYFPLTDSPNDRGLSRRHIFAAVDASLRRLNSDYIDLYQVHRWDYSTPIEETMEALHDVVKAGKVRYLGASSMFAWQFASAQFTARLARTTPFISMQNLYNLAYREEEREMMPFCRANGVGIVPYSPLARGLLARRADSESRHTARSDSDPLAEQHRNANDADVVAALQKVALARGQEPSQLALAWLLAKDAVTAPIVGATEVRHVRSALASLEITLDGSEIEELESPYRPHPVVGHD
jgi:aryl-alcohol dehydrogenase-like predicted oxidoreductase